MEIKLWSDHVSYVSSTSQRKDTCNLLNKKLKNNE